jgi:hypothetical protein
VIGLLASPGHHYDGRPRTTTPEQAADRRERLEVRAGFGIVGDRYAGRPANPCAWLDGVLRLGAAVLRSAVALDTTRAGKAVRPAVRSRPGT